MRRRSWRRPQFFDESDFAHIISSARMTRDISAHLASSQTIPQRNTTRIAFLQSAYAGSSRKRIVRLPPYGRRPHAFSNFRRNSMIKEEMSFSSGGVP
jgi:hypothetical protein